jgi:ribose-phosphate pyrophosphokinase
MRKVLAWPGSRLAAALAAQLGCECSELAFHRFPDGEHLVRIDTDVSGCDVVVVASLDHADAKFLPLAFACDAARELGARRIVIAAPYLGYMRQDRRFHPGEAVSSRTFARLLSSVADALVTVDPHLHRCSSLSQIYAIPTRVVHAVEAIAQWIRQNVDSPLVVGPDEESRQWAAEIARLAHAPCVVLEKVRAADADVTVRLGDAPPAGRWTPVLVDDIASTGRTLIAAAAELRRAGLPNPVAVAVHALLDQESLAAMRVAGIETFVSCDTVEHASNAITIAPALAQCVANVTAA